MTGHSNKLAMPIHRIRDASLSARSCLFPPLLYSGFRLHSFSNREPAQFGRTFQANTYTDINIHNVVMNEVTGFQILTWPPKEDEFKVIFETSGVEHILPKNRKVKSHWKKRFIHHCNLREDKQKVDDSFANPHFIAYSISATLL